ncbi:NAD-dependent epimerase/dehydratase family protein [Mucilaginibacter sabulilitoris]|uniref:NAD-dependent epimerase/dehydratase family protein n=1 Tax=Mucilaginibacter sabulilitoris TaxID=1173583 RepID=A0ABZ0TEX2_9SPHI|nr:NAD-dependent epimerase/dehydratase family protein [Mucilaginibacter sabulilitoris]WPU91740.1 NAD-dependent epimerase/dehydratase family protein [Mucilaginibacter sabulilitoris]
MNNRKVLLTGVTGFLGSHTAIQLLNKGYEVIGTVRAKNRINSIRNVIAAHTDQNHKLSFVVADLSDKEIWTELTQGVEFVQHVASPFPRELPKHEDELIVPAKNGTLNILNAAAANNVKRVVMTSSLAAIAYGKSKEEFDKVFNENDWTDINQKKDITPYLKSKTIAEKAAWDIIRDTPSTLELVTVCPGAILGPVIEQDFGTSANIVISLLNGSYPAIPKIGFDIVDVRSVADLLIRAMEIPKAAGNRYIAASEYLTMKEVSGILKEHYPERKIPTAEFPNFVTRVIAMFRPELEPVLLEMKRRKTDISKAINELQWQPISAREAVVACAESVLEHKIVI